MRFVLGARLHVRPPNKRRLWLVHPSNHDSQTQYTMAPYRRANRSTGKARKTFYFIRFHGVCPSVGLPVDGPPKYAGARIHRSPREYAGHRCTRGAGFPGIPGSLGQIFKLILHRCFALKHALKRNPKPRGLCRRSMDVATSHVAAI